MKTFRTEADDVRMIEVTHVDGRGHVTIRLVPDERPAPARKSLVTNDESDEQPATRSPRLDFITQAGEAAELWRGPRQERERPTTDDDLTVRERFARDTATWWIPALARERGFDA